MIRDGESYFGCTLESWPTMPIMREATRKTGRRPPPLSDIDLSAAPAAARVYRGLWLADCPCGGAELVWKGAAQLWCASCANASLGGSWRLVTLPPDMARIEAALQRRPREINQNWRPHQTVADLLAENEEHGS